jgi:hypothetical protein
VEGEGDAAVAAVATESIFMTGVPWMGKSSFKNFSPSTSPTSNTSEWKIVKGNTENVGNIGKVDSCLMNQRAPIFVKGVPSDSRVKGRLKQIQYGKNTVGYDNYAAAVPK